MLKYERISKENKIAVTYKGRTGFFTRDFSLALAVAVVIHFSFLFLFNIKDIGLLFQLRPSSLIFNVESDPVFNQLSVDPETVYSGEEIVGEPPYAGLALRTIPLWSVEKHVDEKLHHLNSMPLFLSAEDRFFSEQREILPKPLAIHLYHGMANREIVDMPIFEKIRENGYATFNVQVDDKSGKVIWCELKNSSGGKDTEGLAKTLLHQVTFDALADSFVTAGEVEMRFHD